MPKFRMNIALGSAALSTACAGSPDPVFYLLDHETQVSNNADAATRIALAEISLPAYARGVKIASIGPGMRLTLDDDHRWSAPPAEAISAVLSRNLEDDLGAAVVSAPYPRGLSPDLQLEIALDRFVRTTDGGAHLRGQYLVIDGPSRTVSHIERFDIAASSTGLGYDGFMGAVGDAVDRLSQEIAMAIGQPAPLVQSDLDYNTDFVF